VAVQLLSEAKQDSVNTIMKNESDDLFHRQMISGKTISISHNEARTGYLLSPNYPQPYPAGSISQAVLTALDPHLDSIRLSFEDLNLHTSNYCYIESITIYKGRLDPITNSLVSQGTSIFTICGTAKRPPVVISHSILILQFSSDDFSPEGNRGFKIRFEFMDSRSQLYNGCDEPNQFRCRNRLCIDGSLKCNRIDDCGDASDEDASTPCHDLPTISYSTNYPCGLLAESGQSVKSKSDLIANRIVGGGRVGRNYGWPFQVSIQAIGSEPVAHICGATLIHPMFVLSAAHCFKSAVSRSKYKLIFGSRDLRLSGQQVPTSGVQVRYATSISLYPSGEFSFILDKIGFTHIDTANDLALIELNAPVKLTASVWPACLPHLGEPLIAERRCMASGYGQTQGTGNMYAQKQVEQRVVHSSDCISLRDDFQVDDYTMICVKNQHLNGVCMGDSGGPLFCADDRNNLPTAIDMDSINNEAKPREVIKYLPMGIINDSGPKTYGGTAGSVRYTVHGITSFTTDGNFAGGFCGLESVPTIYARVSTKVEWILAQMKQVITKLGSSDRLQDVSKRSSLFGYMFRSGLSRHPNFTSPMTLDCGKLV